MTLTKEQMDLRMAELSISPVNDQSTWERMNGPPPVKPFPVSPGLYVGNINMHQDGPLPTMSSLYTRLLGPIDPEPAPYQQNASFSLNLKPGGIA